MRRHHWRGWVSMDVVSCCIEGLQGFAYWKMLKLSKRPPLCIHYDLLRWHSSTSHTRWFQYQYYLIFSRRSSYWIPFLLLLVLNISLAKVRQEHVELCVCSDPSETDDTVILLTDCSCSKLPSYEHHYNNAGNAIFAITIPLWSISGREA